ncbi:MAG: ImmA/IrrE family metallo-endopeptidase [Candidatus Rokubacteria bacterium]|nr:ImmA/IrrE family metallo-endopeptidase [Candidatus Rokubacteria bacterium]
MLARQAIHTLRDELEFVGKAKSLVDLSGVESPPVDPRRLAALQGIRHVFLSHRLDVSGQILRIGGELVIRLNAIETPARQNFSCCHEIAHTFALGALPRCRSTIGAACGAPSREEYLCDVAASEMLMPEKLFRPAATALEPSLESVGNLAHRFGASTQATMRRIGALDVWPVLFIVWQFMGRRDGLLPKLRVSWSVRRSDARCFVPRYASADPRSSMYASFLTGRRMVESERLSIGDLRGRYVIESGKFRQTVLSIVHDPNLRRNNYAV